MANQAVVGVLRALLQLNTAEYDSGMKRSAAETKAFAKTAETAVAPALAKVEAQMQRTGQNMARMVSYLNGDKLLAQANKIVLGVQEVGGATKLTDSEAAKLNATLTKAIDKYRVLGQEAPKAMLALANATKRASTASAVQSDPMKTLAGIGSQVGSSLIAPLGVAALATGSVMLLKRMTSQTFEAAGALVDLSNKTGLSIETLQRMQYVAGQAGGSLDGFADASFKLGVRLAGGSGSVREAVQALGVDFDRLLAQTPSEQFETIAIALSGITNAAERNRLGVELFGKSFAGIASAVAEGYDKIAKGARIAGDAQVKALDDAADAIKRLKDGAASLFTQLVGGFLAERQSLTTIQELLETLPLSERRRLESLRVHAGSALDALKEWNRQLAQMDERDRARSGLQRPAAPEQSFVEQLAAVDAQLAKLTATERTEIDAALELGVSASALEDKYGLTDGALGRYRQNLKETTKETKAASDAAIKHAEALQAIRAGLTQQGDIDAGQDMVEAIGTTDVTGLAPEQQARIYETLSKAIAAYEQAGRIAPAAMKVLAESTRLAANSVDGSADSIVSSVGAINDKLTELAERQGDADALESLGRVKGIDDFLRAQAERQDELDRLADEDERRMAEDERRDAEHIQRRREQQDDEAEDAKRKAREDARQWQDEWTQASENVAVALHGLTAPGGAMEQFLVAVQQGIQAGRMIRGGIDQFQGGSRTAGALNAIAGGAQAYGGFMAATSTGGMGQRVGGGALYGAQVGGSIVPGYGHAVGAGVGAIAGYLRASDALDDERVQTDQAFNDWLKMMAVAAAVGVNGGTLLARVNQSVSDSYADIGLSAEQAGHDLQDLQDASRESAEAFDAVLERINGNLERQSQLTDARRQRQELLNNAVQRYGFTMQEAGRIFQRQTLADQAEQLIQDWKLLIESGADPSVVAQRMAQAASVFVQQAVQTGTEIPEALRPMLREMASVGVLLDENGQSFRVEMLEFGSELESMFEHVLDRLDALIEALTATKQSTLERYEGGGSTGVKTGETGVKGQGVLDRFARRAHSGWFVGDLATDERVAVLQTKEAVFSRGLMALLGGKAGYDALAAGRLPPAALANFELPDLHGYASAAFQDTWASPNLGDNNGAMAAFAGRQDGAGDIHVRVDQVIVKSDRPEQAAEAFLDALPMAVSRNRKGLRSKLRRQLK